MTAAPLSIDPACVNAVRTLAIDAVQNANSGHPGLPLGAAPMATVLWQRHLRHDPARPSWPDRDRFVLSAGHGSMLQYALLHLAGYDLSLDDLRAFRQWGSRTPGHPEVGVTAGVEATTGPLGQGTANVVGMALAERALAHRFNRPGHTIVDHHTYALVSDGDLMEGIAAEAASLAGHLGLGKLTYLYDANDVSLDGPLDLAFSEDVGRRYEACGWHVLEVGDGDRDLAALDAALTAAREETQRPTLIIVKTTIGFGSPAKAGTAASHGAPLGEDEVLATKKALGCSELEPFAVPESARAGWAPVKARGQELSTEWQARFDAWAEAHPDLAAEWERVHDGRLPEDFDGGLPSYELGEKVATRAAGGKALCAVAARVPELIGGDADLSCSTKTAMSGESSFEAAGGSGRNVHFGVREHAMGAIANGIALHGGLRPYTATFFCFADYMRPAMRLAALSELPVVHVFTHDSVAVGEDGPTHQPVEHLASLRAMPGLHVVRAGDPVEAGEAWAYALRRTEGPTTLVFSRQGMPTLDRSRRAADGGFDRGAYVLRQEQGALAAIVIGTGAELSLAMDAATALEAEGVGVRVVSMPCWERFAEQDEGYRESVLPAACRARVSVEAGATFGWERWIGGSGVAVGIDRFGASAPGGELLQRFGFHAERVAEAVREAMARSS